MEVLFDEYHRIESALNKYEHGEQKIMATYSEIKKVEKKLFEMVGNDKTMKLHVRLAMKLARLKVREIKLIKLL